MPLKLRTTGVSFETPVTSGSDAANNLINAAPLTNGGTGASITPGVTVGGIPYFSSSTAMAAINGVTTAGFMLRSGASTLPTWSSATYPNGAGSGGQHIRSDGTNWVASTATWPGTCVTNSMIYANTTNSYAQLATVNSAVLTTTSAGVPTWATTTPIWQTVATKTTTYSALITDCVLLADTTTAGFTITLPAASAKTGLRLHFKKTSADANILTIARAGADTFEGGGTSVTRTTQFGSYTIYSDGVSVWYIEASTGA